MSSLPRNGAVPSAMVAMGAAGRAVSTHRCAGRGAARRCDAEGRLQEKAAGVPAAALGCGPEETDRPLVFGTDPAGLLRRSFGAQTPEIRSTQRDARRCKVCRGEEGSARCARASALSAGQPTHVGAPTLELDPSCGAHTFPTPPAQQLPPWRCLGIGATARPRPKASIRRFPLSFPCRTIGSVSPLAHTRTGCGLPSTHLQGRLPELQQDQRQRAPELTLLYRTLPTPARPTTCLSFSPLPRGPLQCVRPCARGCPARRCAAPRRRPGRSQPRHAAELDVWRPHR
eukprot:352949-Chlamydomonas_euryale.AAC.2